MGPDQILPTLNWATKNPDFDFNSLLPNLVYSNDEILRYLTILLNQLVVARKNKSEDKDDDESD